MGARKLISVAEYESFAERWRDRYRPTDETEPTPFLGLNYGEAFLAYAREVNLEVDKLHRDGFPLLPVDHVRRLLDDLVDWTPGPVWADAEDE